MWEDGKIENFELFEPFKSLYEGAEIECQLKEAKGLPVIPENVCTSARSVGRISQYVGMILGLLKKINGLE